MLWFGGLKAEILSTAPIPDHLFCGFGLSNFPAAAILNYDVAVPCHAMPCRACRVVLCRAVPCRAQAPVKIVQRKMATVKRLSAETGIFG